MIYLDNAATTAIKPVSVRHAMQEAMTNYSANPGRGGYALSMDTAEMVYGCRERAARMFGLGQAEGVVFTQNCTHALNFAIKGLMPAGGKAVVSSLEHNAVMRPLTAMRQQGVRTDTAEVIFGDDDATFRSFERLIDADTNVVICTHASNVCGLVLPIGRIGRLCRQRGIPFIVDAAQSAGMIPIDMTQMCIDCLCMPGHKGLYGPPGTGMLLTGRTIPQTVIEGGTGTFSIDFNQPENLPERLESGTINTVGIAGLSAGLAFVEQKGIGRIHDYEIGLLQELYDGLRSIREVVLYMDRPSVSHFSPVLSFTVEGMPSEQVGEELAQAGFAVRAGLHCAPTAHRRLGTLEQGTVRVSPSVFSRREHIRAFCAQMKKIVKKKAN